MNASGICLTENTIRDLTPDLHSLEAMPDPLNPAEVFSTLQAACSQNYADLKVATAALEVLHKHPDFLDIVQSIAAEKSVDLNVRKMAILEFKNLAIAQWRSKM